MELTILIWFSLIVLIKGIETSNTIFCEVTGAVVENFERKEAPINGSC